MRTSHDTRLVGVLVHPVGENPFFDLLAAAAAESDANTAFLQFDAQPKHLADPVRALQSIGAAGVYLTGRLRNAADGLVDYLSDDAHGTGVINTITFDRDQATGHNTEALAMLAVLDPYRDQLSNGVAVILGGGSLARSAAWVLARQFRVRHIAIADRAMQQAQLLKQTFQGLATESKIEAHELFPPDLADILAEARLIINATSVGSWPGVEETPVSIRDVFHNRQVVLDVTYAPGRTQLLSDAAAAGAHTISGLDLLQGQIARSFELLTGSPFPDERVTVANTLTLGG